MYLISGKGKQQSELLSTITTRYKLSSLNWKIQRLSWFDFKTTSSNYYSYSYGNNNTSAVVKVSEGSAISLPHDCPLEKVWEFLHLNS